MATAVEHKLNEGDVAPAFEGVDENGSVIKLSDYAGKKLVLFFYPKDNTPGCTAEACNLRDNYRKFQKKGYDILGVSADSQRKHQNFIEKFELPFPLIADTDKTMIHQFGVWGRKKFMGREYEGIMRTTFVINEEGTIEQIIRKVKTKDHSAQILEA